MYLLKYFISINDYIQKHLIFGTVVKISRSGWHTYTFIMAFQLANATVNIKIGPSTNHRHCGCNVPWTHPSLTILPVPCPQTGCCAPQSSAPYIIVKNNKCDDIKNILDVLLAWKLICD